MKNRTITGLFVAILFVVVVICSLKVHHLFFDALVLLLMIMGVIEVRRAIKNKLGNAAFFLVLYVCCFGYAWLFIINNIGKRSPILGTSVYILIIAVAIVYNWLYHYILRRISQKHAAIKSQNLNDTNEEASDCAQSEDKDSAQVQAIIQNDDKSVQDAAVFTPVDVETTTNATALCLLYPTVLLILMLSLNYLVSPYRGAALILLFTVSPFADVLAYVVGSTLKGKKLCPKISPKKTISGAIGGLFGGLLGGVFLILLTTNSAFNWLEMGGMIGASAISNTIHCIMLGIGGSVCTQAGDILASYIKRKCGIKDFGHLLPGHGGVMDRIDGMILNASFIFIYMSILAL